MAMFQNVSCSICGNKASMLTRTRLADGNYVCHHCTTGVPSYIRKSLKEYNLDSFRKMKQFLDYSKTTLKQRFRATHHYMSIALDTQNGLFCLEDLRGRLYLPLADLEEFSLEFDPQEAKEGLLTDKVTGAVWLTMQMGAPYFRREEVIASGVKTSAVQKGIFNKKLVYDLPKGMGEFLLAFNEAWLAAKEAQYERLTMEAVQIQKSPENLW